MKMHKQNNWRQLDDQAKIYSLSRNDYDTSIFRLSVLLKDKINKKILETAVIKTLEQYKAYKVKMEGGFFWYYLDANDKNPIVTEENDHPFKKINTIENNNYLFKVTYFDKKITMLSYILRMAGIALALVLAFKSQYFDGIAAAIPILVPRLIIFVASFFENKEDQTKKDGSEKI